MAGGQGDEGAFSSESPIASKSGFQSSAAYMSNSSEASAPLGGGEAAPAL